MLRTRDSMGLKRERKQEIWSQIQLVHQVWTAELLPEGSGMYEYLQPGVAAAVKPTQLTTAVELCLSMSIDTVYLSVISCLLQCAKLFREWSCLL